MYEAVRKKRSFLFGRLRASSNIDMKEGAGGNRLKFSNVSDERFFRKHRNANPSLFVAMRLHFAGGAVIFLGFLLAQTFIAALTCPSHSLRSSRAVIHERTRKGSAAQVGIRPPCFSSGFYKNVRQLQGFDALLLAGHMHF